MQAQTLKTESDKTSKHMQK